MANADEQHLSLYKGEVIYKRKDKPDFAYLIQRGSVNLFLKQENKKEIVEHVKTGQVFGEVEIIKGGRRAYNAEADEYTTLVKIDRKTLQVVYKESLPIVKTLIEQLADKVVEQRKSINVLKKKEKIADHYIALGGGLDDGSFFMAKSFKSGETIYKEGENANCGYRIKKGMIQLFKLEQEANVLVETLKEGDMFGEIETIGGSPRPFTAKSKENCDLEKIDRPTLKKLVKESHPIIRGITKKIMQRLNSVEDRERKYRLFENSFMGFCTYLYLLATLDDPIEEDGDPNILRMKGRAAVKKQKIAKQVPVNMLQDEIKDVLLKLKSLNLIEIELPEKENGTTIITIPDIRPFLKRAQRAYDTHIANN